jgi:hypothetical protein
MKEPKVKNSWLKIMGLSLSLPGLIFFCGWFMHYATSNGYVSKPVGLILFLAVIFNTFYLIIRYAINKKN